jgi:pilus assembly protein FimV
MFRKALRHVGLLVLAALLSAHAYAIGLGEIQLKSALNEPLNAEIPLLQVKGLGENDILVGIAPKDDFEAAGIDRLFFLASLRFSLDLNNSKGPLVHITTDAPVREPYLNFLLEVQWPSGRLLREYTLLMDLPASGNASMARVIKGTEVPAASPAKVSGKTKSATIDVKELDSELATVENTPEAAAPAPGPASQSPVPEAAPGKKTSTVSRSKPKEVAAANTSRAPVAKPKKERKPGVVKQHEQANQASEAAKPVEESAPSAGQDESHAVVPVYETAPVDGNYPVKTGDNLWSIAMKYRKADEGSTVQQAMLAIQRMNPDAFANGNINRLRKGKVLRMPTHDDLANITSREAIDEVRKQNLAWSGSAGGKRAALAAAPEQIDATHQHAAAETPAVENQEGHLKLSVPGAAKGSASGKARGAKAGAVAALQNELSTAMEELDRHKHEKANVSGQLSALDEQTKTMQQMLDVHNAELAALQESMAKKAAQQKAAEAVAPQPPVETTPAQTPPAQENAAATTEAPAVEQAPAKTEPTPATAPAKNLPAEGSSNMAWIAGGLITLVLLVVIISKLRSRESEVDLASKIEEAVKTVPVTETPAPAPKAPPVVPVAEAPVPPKAPPVVPVAEAPVPPKAPPVVPVAEVPAPKAVPPVVAPTAPVKAEERISVAESAPLAKVVEPAVPVPPPPPPAPVVEAKPQTANPVDEADIYISFGTYDKAASLLKGAISAEPKRTDLRLELLEVYSATENLRAFDEQLALLSGLHDASAITRANEMRSRMAGAAPVPATKAPEPQESDLHFDLGVAEDLSVDLDNNFRLDSDITAKTSVVKPNETDLDLESIDQGTLKGGFSEAPTVQQRALDISKLKTAESPAVQASQARTEVRDSFDASQANRGVAAKPEPVKPPVARIDLDLDLELADESAKNDPTVRSPKIDISDTPTVQQRALDISKLKTAESPAVQASEGRTEVRDSVDLDKAKLETSTAVTGSNDIVSLDEDLDFSVDADEVATKLDLAKAYIDMGDKEGAKDILQEVMEEGQAAQKQEAKKLLDSIG